MTKPETRHTNSGSAGKIEPAVIKERRADDPYSIIIRKGTSEAHLRIDETFGGDPFHDPSQLAYHRGSHSRGVVNRYLRLARAVQRFSPDLMPERSVLLGAYITARHDEIQKWQENTVLTDPQSRPMRKRKRAVGENETETAELAIGYLIAANKEAGEEIVTPAEMRTVRNAILLTIPNFDTQKGTVTQPRFANYTDDIVVQLTGLSDLGGGGMEGVSTARWEADALFVEENLDFTKYVAQTEAGGKRDPQEEAKFTDRMLGWLKSQTRFNIGRQSELLEEIPSMNPLAQDAVRNVFTKYDETIKGIEELIEERQKMDFNTWLADIRSTLNNPPEYPDVDRL